MQRALEWADLTVEDVQYVNAHGTSTPPNDRTETLAVAEVFGDQAEKLNINSTKSMLGHLLGASGAVESIVCALTIHQDKVHPTVNQEMSDPDCFLNYTPNQAIEREVTAAISNSFGFGGHNVSLAFKQFEQ